MLMLNRMASRARQVAKAVDTTARAQQDKINSLIARDDFYQRVQHHNGYDMTEHGARLYSYDIETKTWG